MEKIYRGIKLFKTYYERERKLFEKLIDSQSPIALFITCSDSRIDPNLITQSKPGELFVLRNVGNIIPPYDLKGEKDSVASAIEFAIEKLKVRDIIICGHSNCVAMRNLFLEDPFFENMPHLKNWLQIASQVRDNINLRSIDVTNKECQTLIEKENILVQLNNLKTYPIVKKALENKELRVHGWHYDIGNGIIYAYNTDIGVFEEIV